LGIHRRREPGWRNFLDIRDREGITQFVLIQIVLKAFAIADSVRNEFVVKNERLCSAARPEAHNQSQSIGALVD